MNNGIFDQLKRKAQELDEKLDLKSRIEQGVNVASDVAKAANETINQAASTAREQFGKIDEQYKVTDNLRDTAAKTEGIISRGGRFALPSRSDPQPSSNREPHGRPRPECRGAAPARSTP